MTLPSSVPSSSATVEERLDELTDLVRRRLLDDRDKRRMLDDLTERLHTAEQGVFRQVLHPLVAGLALALDRCDRYDGTDPQFVASLRDELLELLSRHGVHTVPTDGEVDVRRHEVVGTVVGEENDERYAVHSEVRRGLQHDGWVFRPAQVIASVPPRRSTAPTVP